MEAVRKSQPSLQLPPAEPAPPKLTIEKFSDGGIACLKFTGTIDETFDGKKLARSAEAATLVLDLGGVKKISSFGIREWVDFVAAASKHARELVLIECSPKVVDQLNMVANFSGGGRVYSFYAPFRCDYCDSDHRVLLDVAHDFDAIRGMKLAERPCPSCKEPMYFDEEGSTYFSYVLGQGAFELEPGVAQFLAAKLDYRVGTVEAKMRVDKLIEGRVTYLRLTGNLDPTFPRDKLAEGVEGLVVIDVAGVGRVEPAGAAEWRAFVQQVTPLVERLDLIGVAPAFLEKLCGRDDLGAKGHVIDLTLPYTCPACGTTTAQTIEVAAHHAVLKFATAPELHCPACKAAMQCTASEAAMTVLPGLPEPALGKGVARTIAELRARKLDKKPSAAIAPLPRPADAAPRRSPAVPIAIGVIAVAVLGGGAFAIAHLAHHADAGPFGLGPVAASSEPARPAWLASAGSPGTAGCTTAAGRITCTGVSSILASQEEAEDEASDAALEALAVEAGHDVRDATWTRVVPGLFGPARDAALAAFARDPESSQARRTLHDGRRAVARALAAGSGPQVGARYWEAFDTRDGRRFVAFAEVDVAARDVARAAQGYAASASALGATVVPFFPELGWRYPKLDHGALVTHLEHGPLQDLGLAERYVVLAIDGREVADAASFAKIASEEYAQLAERGGTLRLLVQADSGDPREFSKTIAGKATAAAPSRPRDVRPPDAPPVGGINVWDRYGGGGPGG